MAAGGLPISRAGSTHAVQDGQSPHTRFPGRGECSRKAGCPPSSRSRACRHWPSLRAAVTVSYRIVGAGCRTVRDCLVGLVDLGPSLLAPIRVHCGFDVPDRFGPGNCRLRIGLGRGHRAGAEPHALASKSGASPGDVAHIRYRRVVRPSDHSDSAVLSDSCGAGSRSVDGERGAGHLFSDWCRRVARGSTP